MESVADSGNNKTGDNNDDDDDDGSGDDESLAGGHHKSLFPPFVFRFKSANLLPLLVRTQGCEQLESTTAFSVW